MGAVVRRRAVGIDCAVGPGRVLIVDVGKVGAVAEGCTEDLWFVGGHADIALMGPVLVGADFWRLWLNGDLD